MFEAVTLVLPEPIRKFPGIPVAFHTLLEGMLRREPEDRLTAAAVHAEATRLAEMLSETEGPIEEVEVELIDISRNPPPMPSLGWMPPPPAQASRKHQVPGTPPGHNEPRSVGPPRPRTTDR
jgi:hypothetical protein